MTSTNTDGRNSKQHRRGASYDQLAIEQIASDGDKPRQNSRDRSKTDNGNKVGANLVRGAQDIRKMSSSLQNVCGTQSDDDVLRHKKHCAVSMQNLKDGKGKPGVLTIFVDSDADTPRASSENIEPKNSPPFRMLIVSNKIRNTSMLKNGLLQNVIYIPYKYDSMTLDDVLRVVGENVGKRKVASIAIVTNCSGSSILLTGKDEKSLNKDSVQEGQPLHVFFTTLTTTYIDTKLPYARLDFLVPMASLVTEGQAITREIQSFLQLPVGFSRDIEGCEVPSDTSDAGHEGKNTNIFVGSLYFNLDKLRGWSGHYQQSLAGFEKIRTVGKGAYGAAVLYRKKDDDSLVILKEINMHDLNASERQLALNEIKVLAVLDHPNIISYYDSFEEDGVLMIEMEYADGGTLAHFLSQQDKPLEERDILCMFQQIVAAIRYIHEHNILHRDLKTANIFLTREGVVKVGDFGISKILSSGNKGANTVLGTPYYISPEMCEGKPYDEKSDIWALGCILYEICCLQKTFEGSNLPALVNKIMKGQFAPVKGNYSAALKRLIEDFLKRLPEDRPSANDILYEKLPEMMSTFDEKSDVEDELMSSMDGVIGNKKKKTRSVLYYLETSTLKITPVDLPPRIKIRQASVGADHVIVVSMERQVYAWGDGSKGQLGHGDIEFRSLPVIVESLKGKSISRVSSGAGFSVFGSDNGIVLTCGDGSHGCLGHGDWSSIHRPRLIEALLSVDVISFSCGPKHVAVVGSSGEVFTWGCGADGRLGHGNEDNLCQPTEVHFSDPSVIVRDVRCGIDGTMFLTDVGSVYACGNNENNKLGLNNRQGFLMAMKNIFTKAEVEGRKVPTPVRALGRYRVVDVSMGAYHTAVIVEPGHVYTFGRNSEGQLGTGNTKTSNTTIEVKLLHGSIVNSVQCADHFTAAGTVVNELYFWGLRYIHPQPIVEAPCNYKKDGQAKICVENASHVSSNNSSGNISLSHQSGAGSSIDSSSTGALKEGSNSKHMPVPQPLSKEQQISTDSVFSSSSPVNGHNSTLFVQPDDTEMLGFKPLSCTPSRALSTSSGKDKDKEKEREKELLMRDDIEILFEPTHILRLVDREEAVTLANFYCHGENLFVQVETTAPLPAKRRARKKRSFRKRPVKNNLNVPPKFLHHSASSREGGDEYSSETSEMDSQGTLCPAHLKLSSTYTSSMLGSLNCLTINFQKTIQIPTWIMDELAMDEDQSDQDGRTEPTDDTSDQSDGQGKHHTTNQFNSLASIQINNDLKNGTLEDSITPRVENTIAPAVSQPVTAVKPVPQTTANGEANVKRRPLSTNSTDSVIEPLSSSSSSEVFGNSINGGHNNKNPPPVFQRKVTLTSPRKPAPPKTFRSRSESQGGQKPLSRIRAQGKGRGRSYDMTLKEQLAARGFVSDVTVKRREETLQNELEKIRQEKCHAEERLKEMADVYNHQHNCLKEAAEQKAQGREKRLKEQIDALNNKLQDNEKRMKELQDQLMVAQGSPKKTKHKFPKTLSPRREAKSPTNSKKKESRVCLLQ